MEDRIDYFERMLADNPDNPTGLLALANEYRKAGRDEDEAAVLQRYLAKHEHERTVRQHMPQIRFRTRLTEEALEIQQGDEGIKGPRVTSSEKDRHRIHRGFIGVGEHCNGIALR